eukprot:TRINITY_DN867_c0_g1_i19.p1 TRINITY_DN867_c0_g1~~TRINITY_DN867_c0_g1_i19.p1  ORF type:complete len:1463 (-),score=386.83 TRINITY_DN867_c0_g1_i19:272-4660(-)
MQKHATLTKWSGPTDPVSHMALALALTLIHQAQEGNMYFYDPHLRANQLNAHLNGIAAIAIGASGIATNTTLDSHFLTLLRELRNASNATSVYVGLAATGEVLGATVYEDSTVCVMTQSAGSDMIYYGTTGTGASEVRDTGNEVARYTEEQDSRQATWYLEGKGLGQSETGSVVGNTGHTGVYAFNNSFMIVSVVTPYFDSSSNLLGVLGVDSTFNSAQTILADARASTTGSFVAVERLAEEVASATGDSTIWDSRARLIPLNATDDSGVSSEVEVLMSDSGGNMTAAQNLSCISGTATVYATISGSRYVSTLDPYFNSLLGEWTLVEVEARDTFYENFDNGYFTAFAIVFFLAAFVLTVVMLLLYQVMQDPEKPGGCSCLDRRGATVAPEEPEPVQSPDRKKAAKQGMTPVERFEAGMSGSELEGSLATLQGLVDWCKAVLIWDPAADIHVMKPSRLLRLARRRLAPIVDRIESQVMKEVKLIEPDTDTGAGVGLPLEEFKTETTAISGLQPVPGLKWSSVASLRKSTGPGERSPPTSSRRNKLSEVQSGVLTPEQLDWHKRQDAELEHRMQDLAIRYMLKADLGHNVFEAMSLESRLGEDHLLTRLHARYLGAPRSKAVFTFAVLLYTTLEIGAGGDTKILGPTQGTLIIFFWLDGIVTLYVEYIADGFVRSHSIARVVLLIGMWVGFMTFVFTDTQVHNTSALVCPFLLITRIDSLRIGAFIILRGLVKAKTVFYLLFLTVAVTAVMANLFFFQEFSGKTSTELGGSVDNFFDSMVTMFVYLCGGENYEDLVFQGYEVTTGSWLFFLPVSVVGNFFLMTLVIATFQDTYRKHKDYLDRINNTSRKLELCSSFVLWTWGRTKKSDGALTNEDFAELMKQYWAARGCSFQSVSGKLKAVENMRESLKSFSLAALCAPAKQQAREAEEEMASEIFSTIDRDSSGAIEFKEFVLVLAVSRCVEMLRKRGGDNSLNDQLRGARVIAAKWEGALDVARKDFDCARRTGKSDEVCQGFREEFEKHQRFLAKAVTNLNALEHAADSTSLILGCIPWRTMDVVLVTIVLGQAFILSLYGNKTDYNQRAILYSYSAINFVYPVEMFFRIRSAGGLENYIRDGRRPWTRMANLLQFALVAATTLGTIPTLFLSRTAQRIATGVIAINLFRALLLLEKVSKLLYSFSFGFRPMSAYGGLFYVIYYAFSWLAFQLFEGKITDHEFRNFNTFGMSMLTMFQVFLGEAWYNVMGDAVRATTNLYVVFFVLYVLMVRVLIADFIVGMVIDLFHTSRQRSETHVGQIEMIFDQHCQSLDELTKADLIRSLGWVGSVIYQPVMKNLDGLEVLEHKFGSDILKHHEGDVRRWAAVVLQRRLKSSRARWASKRQKVERDFVRVVKKQDTRDNLEWNERETEKQYGKYAQAVKKGVDKQTKEYERPRSGAARRPQNDWDDPNLWDNPADQLTTSPDPTGS